MASNEQIENERQLFIAFLKEVIGDIGQFDVCIAVADAKWCRMKGDFVFQVMSSEDFFDWYCEKKPNNQFFYTPKKAAEQYLKYRFIWQNGRVNG